MNLNPKKCLKCKRIFQPTGTRHNYCGDYNVKGSCSFEHRVPDRYQRQIVEMRKRAKVNYYKNYPVSAEYRDKQKQRARLRRIKERKILIDFLGGKCKKCGFADYRALQIDHINGGGGKEIKANPHLVRLKKYLEHIKANPIKYQLLCANCNWIKVVENKENIGNNAKYG